MSWKTILVVFVGCLSPSLKPASAQSFTLQQIMSGTFNSELQAAPKGSRVVWMANQEGKRNVWVADVASADLAPRQLTAYTADDGQDIGDITWTPDAQSIVYVYGGDFEFPGRPDPNPALLAAGVEQTIFIVPINGGKPRRIAAGRSPSVSPDGKTVAFLAKEGIWTVPLADESAKPALMFHARGTAGAPVWSPDGKYVAFTSNRGDHGFVGVYSIAEKTITYMDPSTQTDRYPEWSPDSRQIAFVRSSAGGWRRRCAPHRRALVDPHRRRRHRSRPRGMARRQGAGQCLSPPGNRPAAVLDPGRSPHLPVRGRRLGASLLRCHQRRHAGPANSRRLRGRARRRQPRPHEPRLQLQPGRHRSPARMATRRRWQSGDRTTHQGRRHRSLPGDDRQRKRRRPSRRCKSADPARAGRKQRRSA